MKLLSQKTFVLVVEMVVYLFGEKGESANYVQYALIGGKVILRCDLDISTQWFSVTQKKVIAIGRNVSMKSANTDRLSVTTEYNLVIINTTSSDFDTYRCYGKDKHGTIHTKNITLKQVVYPDNMTVTEESKPGIVHGIQNKNLTLTCTVSSGEPAETLSWKTGNTTVVSGGSGNLRYCFTPDQYDDFKHFTCEAEINGFGITLNYTVELQLTLTPDMNVSANPSSMIIEGSELVLECNDISQPINIFSWTHNGVLLSNISKVLRFERTFRANEGTYTCSGRNDAGEGTADIRIEILYAAKVQDDNKTIYETDKEKKLSCVVSGNPAKFQYGKWKYIPTLSNESRILESGVNGTLIFNEFGYEDTGTYVCNVSNNIPDDIGNVWHTGRVHVEFEGRPRLTTSTINRQIGYIGKTSLMSVAVLCSPAPVYLGLYIGLRKLPNDLHTCKMSIVRELSDNRTVYLKGYTCVFTIQYTKLKDFQNYTLKIENKFGHVSTNILLVHAGPPEKPELSILTSTSNSIFVEWQVGFHGGYNQIVCIEYRMNQDRYWTNISHTDEQNNEYIDDLLPETKYILRMYSYNSMGKSNVTEQYDIWTKDKPNVTSSVIYITSIVSVIMLSISGIFILYWCHTERGKNKGNQDSTFNFDMQSVGEENKIQGIEDDQLDIVDIGVGNDIDHNEDIAADQAAAVAVANPQIASVSDEGYSSIDKRRKLSTLQRVSYKAARNAKVVSTEV